MTAPEARSGHRDYVMRTVEERGVRFVRLWFVDVLRLLKSFAIPVSELEQALDEGVGLDGSALEGTARRAERDVIAHPAAKEAAARIELRLPDPSCNPYLAFALMRPMSLSTMCTTVTGQPWAWMPRAASSPSRPPPITAACSTSPQAASRIASQCSGSR